MCAYVGVAFLKCFTGGGGMKFEWKLFTFWQIYINISSGPMVLMNFFDDNGHRVDIGTTHNKKLDWLQTLNFCLYRTKKDA